MTTGGQLALMNTRFLYRSPKNGEVARSVFPNGNFND